MTYADIVDWVSEHFDSKNYKTYIDLENAVKQRFSDDGVDFPDGAVAWLQEAYKDSFPEVESPIQPKQDVLTDYLSVTPPQEERVEIVPEEITQPFTFDLGTGDISQALPEALQEAPPSKEEPVSFFGSLGRSIRSGLRRLFGR